MGDVEKHRPDGLAEGGASRLARHQHVVPSLAEGVGQELDLSRLARPVEPFEGDEQSGASAAHARHDAIVESGILGRREPLPAELPLPAGAALRLGLPLLAEDASRLMGNDASPPECAGYAPG